MNKATIALTTIALFIGIGAFINRCAADTTSTPDKIFGYGRAECCALTRDGSLLASAGNKDGTILLWDAATATVIKKLKGHTNIVRCLAFTSDGTVLLSGSYDKNVKLWNVSTGECQRTFEIGGDIITGAISPDGSKIILGTFNLGFYLLDAKAEDTLPKIGLGFITSVAFSNSGRSYASGDHAGYVSYHNMQSGISCSFKPTTVGDFTYVAISPNDSQLLVGSGDDTVRLYDIASKTIIQKFGGHTKEISSVGFSSDGSKIITGSNDCTIRLWDAASGNTLTTFTGHTSVIKSTVFVHHDSLILSCSYDQTIRLWDAASAAVNKTFYGFTCWIRDVAFSPDGSKVLAATAGNDLHIWDVKSGDCLVNFIGHTWMVNTAVYSNNGKYVLSGACDSTARLWEISTGKTVRILPGDAYVTCVAMSPDCQSVLVGSENNIVRLYPLSADTVERIFWQSDRIEALAFSADGKTILTGGDYTVRLWNRSDGDLLRSFSSGNSGVSDAGFAFNESIVYAGLSSGEVRFWNAQTGDFIRTFKGGTNAIYKAAVSSDGFFVAGSSSKNAYLWECSSGRLLRTFTGFSDRANSIAFSPDGKKVLVGTEDEDVRLWDISDITPSSIMPVRSKRPPSLLNQPVMHGTIVTFPADIYESTASDARLVILSLQGVVIAQSSLRLTVALKRMDFKLSRKLPSGIYLYCLITGKNKVHGITGRLSVLE
jgi:WD40 repeat protein